MRNRNKLHAFYVQFFHDNDIVQIFSCDEVSFIVQLLMWAYGRVAIPNELYILTELKSAWQKVL